LSKISTFKDPPPRYDSVCIFLTLCPKVAKRGRVKSRMPNHTVSDVLLVLESICGLAKQSNIVCRRIRLEGVSTDVMTELSRTAVIRYHLLYARSPHFQPQEQFPQSSFAHNRVASGTGSDLPQSPGRGISFFLLKPLDSLADEWENGDDQWQITAERASTSLFSHCTLNLCSS
jgi:serine-protein kinase ATM